MVGAGLLDWGTGEDVEVIWVDRRDAGLDFVKGGGADHGGVVTGKFEFGEEKREVGEVGVGLVAEDLIRADAASEDERFSIGMLLEGELKLF